MPKIRQTNLKCLLFSQYFALVLVLSSCAISPPKVNSGATLIRDVVLGPLVESASDEEEDEGFHRFSLGASASKTTGLIDTGERSQASALAFHGEIRPLERWAIGLRPYYGQVDLEVEEQSSSGVEVFSRFAVINTGDRTGGFQWSLYPTLRSVGSRAEEKGEICTGLFACVPSSETSVAEINVFEMGAGMIFQAFFGEVHSLAFVPQIFWDEIKSKNQLASVTVYDQHDRIVNYAGSLHYRFQNRSVHSPLSVHFGAGAATQREFGQQGSKSKLSPIFSFGLAVDFMPSEN